MIPYTTERRGDTGVTNVTLGMWLFIASEVMLFGSLFSAYALIRASADNWAAGGDALHSGLAFAGTAVLLAGSAAAWRARSLDPLPALPWLAGSTFLAFAFIVLKGAEWRLELLQGFVPSTSTFLALYFTLTGLHALHVAGGGIANAWIIAGVRTVPPALTAGRMRAVALYWAFVDAIWLIILTLFHLT